jgi:hypothetical protein
MGSFEKRTQLPRQILFLENKTLWTQKEIVQGLVLRQMSTKAYKYIRRAKLMPLPGISTLRLWIEGFKVEEGLQHDTLHVLRRLLEANPSPHFELSVLSFDEFTFTVYFSWSVRATYKTFRMMYVLTRKSTQ